MAPTWNLYLCWICVIFSTLTQAIPVVKIAGFYKSVDSQAAEAYVRGTIWHNCDTNKTFEFFAYRMTADVLNSYNIGMKMCYGFNNRVSLFTGQTSFKSLNTISSLVNNYMTTFVTTSQSKEEAGILKDNSGDDYFVSIRPSLVQAIIDLLERFQWTEFAYIYQDMEGLQRFYALTKADEFKQRKYEIVLKQVSTPEDTLKALSELRETSRTRMIIDVNLEGIKVILKQLQQLGMVTFQYHYIMTNLDLVKVNFSELVVGGMNLTGFNIIDHTDAKYEIFTRFWNKQLRNNSKSSEIMDTEAALVFDTLEVFNQTIFKLDKLATLLYIRHQRECQKEYRRADPVDDNILSELLSTKLKGVTGNVEFTEKGERKNYTLNILGLSRYGLVKVGEWHSSRERRFNWTNMWVDARPSIEFEDNSNDTTDVCRDATNTLNRCEGTPPTVVVYNPERGIYSRSLEDDENKVFRITTVLEQPFLMRTEGKNGPEFEGYCMDLLNEIIKIYNFSYRIEVEPNNMYGTESNGTYNGMIGQLVNHKADIALAPLTITSSREKVIDFTKPYMSLGVSIMIKKPMSSKPEVFSFLQPLSTDIWMCVAFAFIGVSVVLFLVSRFSSQEWYTEIVQTNGHRCSTPRPIDDPNALEPMDIEKRMNNFSFSNSIWFSLGALMQQGGDTTPRSLAGRIVGGVWWFFTLILISSYTANLAAFLTVERMESPINSAKELKESDIKYGILNTGATYQLFEQSDIPLYQEMFKYMEATEGSYKGSNEEGIAEVRRQNGNYAFLLESTINEYESQQKPCDTLMVPQHIDSKSYGIGVSRGFEELRDQLTLAILQLREDGTLARLRKTWWFDKGKCQESSKDTASALSLSNVAGIFYILIVGLVMALIVAIIDFYWKSRKDAKRDKIGLMRAMKNKVRASVTGERGFRPVPLLLESVASSGKSLHNEKKDLLKKENGQTDV